MKSKSKDKTPVKNVLKKLVIPSMMELQKTTVRILSPVKL